LDVIRAASEIEAAEVSAPGDLLQATEVEFVLDLENTVELQAETCEQLQSQDVLPEETVIATVSEAVDVLSCPPKEEFLTEEAATALDVVAPKEPDVEATITATHEQVPVSEEVVSPENVSDLEPVPEELCAEVREISAELVAGVTSNPPVQTQEAVEEVPHADETVSLDKTPTTDVDAAAEMTVISSPAEDEEHRDLATVDEDVSIVDEMAEEQVVIGEVSLDVDSLPAVGPEVKVETAVEQPLKQASVVEEVYPEESPEPLVTEPTSDEVQPTEVVYEDILQKESIACETVTIDECAAELSIQRPTLPEESETGGVISLPKEEDRIELMQPSVVEESNPEECVESALSEISTEEMRPTEVEPDHIIQKEKVAYETVKTEECSAELSVQQPTSPEEAQAESVISFPQEEEKVELLQPSSVEEFNPEDSVEPLDSEHATEEILPTEIEQDHIIQTESVACETVKIEECVAELSVEQSTLPEEAETEGVISLPKAEEKVELFQPQSFEESHPEESVEELISEPKMEEMHATEVAYDAVLPKEGIKIETVKTEECVAELSVQQPTLPEEAEADVDISLPKEEKKVDFLQALHAEESNPEDSVETVDLEPKTDEIHPTEVVYKEILPKESIACETVKAEECVAELYVQQPSSPEEAQAESVISFPKEEEKVELLQPLSAEESNPEDSVELLDSELGTEEIHPTEVAYDDILPKESVACETVKTEECVAELSVEQSTLPEEAETEGVISLPKEEEKVELLQPQSVEECHPEESFEDLVSEPATEEIHPTEVVYDAVLPPKESIICETVKTEECAAEFSIQQPTLPEEAETEGVISLPREKEKVELLQPLSVEETNPEDSVETHDSAPAMEEIHPTEVAYEAVLPKESVKTETVESEECAVDFSVQRSAAPETAEAEASISLPKEQEEVVSVELKSATMPEVSASLDVVEPEEETVVEIQKSAAVLEQVEVPKPEVAEDVSLTVAKQPTPEEDVQVEESLKIPSPEREREKEGASAFLESMKPEPAAAEEESVSLAMPKPPAEAAESVSLAMRQPEEETDADLSMKLKKSADGMMPLGGGRWRAIFAFAAASSPSCFQLQAGAEKLDHWPPCSRKGATALNLLDTAGSSISVESNENVRSKIAFLLQEIRKIVKTVATICQILRLKCTKIQFRLGLCPIPR